MLSCVVRAGRALVRLKAYSNAGATWAGDLQVALPILIGIGTSAMEGAAAFAGVYVVRIVSGYLDLERIKATDYMNEFMGHKAPGRVKVVK